MKSHWQSSTQKRRVEKTATVLKWLYEFDFSTRSLLCQVLGVKPGSERGQAAFFKKLTEHELIERAPYSIVSHCYQLTKKGQKIAYAEFNNGEPLTYKHNASEATQIHDLSVQLATIRRMGGLQDFTAERHIKNGEQGKAPDCILSYGDFNEDGEQHRIAVEVELSPKEPKLVYHAFFRTSTQY